MCMFVWNLFVNISIDLLQIGFGLFTMMRGKFNLFSSDDVWYINRTKDLWLHPKYQVLQRKHWGESFAIWSMTHDADFIIYPIFIAFYFSNDGLGSLVQVKDIIIAQAYSHILG